MQLGNIFNQTQGEPLVGKDIEFRLLKPSRDGDAQESYMIKGIFFVLTELDKREAHRKAKIALREEYKEFEGIFPSEDEIYTEQKIWEIAFSLRDVEDSRKRLIPERDIPMFKKGLIAPTLIFLIKTYDKFLMEEYPELMDDDQFKGLVDEALKK